MPANTTFMYNPNSSYTIHRHAAPINNLKPAFTSSQDITASSSNDKNNFIIKPFKSCIKNSHSDPNLSQKFFHDESKNSNGFSAEDESASHSDSKKEKRVTFADTQGGALAVVKYVTNTPYDELSKLFTTSFGKGLKKEFEFSNHHQYRPCNTDKTKFFLHFEEPIVNYMKMKKMLDTRNVCLERLFIKNNKTIHGTVKVKNIAYYKQVSIHITFDDWKTKSDEQCEYAFNAYDEIGYDTFKFSIDIPKAYFERESKIEFCVCFVCGSQMYWDNNEGRNYVISPKKNVGTLQSHAIPASTTVNSSPGDKWNSYR